MPDYIYLLENRLSADQQDALRQLREATREAGMLLFLTGDAVRDLTSGHAVRSLEVAVHGNALNLRTATERFGAEVWGEDPASRSLYLCFPGTVRVDVISAHRVEYSKPGHLVCHPASIQEDLRRRDFTVNAMAISLNEGSYGLLMDPMNGAADIETRTLRLVSNYGFLDHPALLIRATRLKARLGWEPDPRTQTRYENAKAENVIEHLSDFSRRQELEQIGHEEDGLKALRALEEEGWMKVLFPAWTVAKVDEEKLEALHKYAVDLLMQGVHADMSAAQMQLLTAKLAAKELADLKKLMLRPGFVDEWNNLDHMAAAFSKVLLAKENTTPSTSFKLFTSYDPEAVLWLGFTSKEKAVQERFNLFLKVWPEARQRIPHALMQEMRITPELSTYGEIVHALFLELIDGRLNTPEELRAFLEPYSPPAPPPQVTIKRSRGKRGAEAKLKERSFEDEDEPEEGSGEDEDLDDLGGDEDEIESHVKLPKPAMTAGMEDDLDQEDDLRHEGNEPDEEISDEEESEDEDELEPVAVKRASKSTPVHKQGNEKKHSALAPAEVRTASPTRVREDAAKHEKPNVAAKHKSEPKPPVASVKKPGKPAVPSKSAAATKNIKNAKHVVAPAKAAPKPLAKAMPKPAAKHTVKSSAKTPVKPAEKTKPGAAAKSAKPSKPAQKRPAPKAGKKR